MVLVMSPIVMFPRRGGVPKRKSFVNTTRLVDTGIYAVIHRWNLRDICNHISVVPTLVVRRVGCYRCNIYLLGYHGGR
jgi:hypothetical protein